MLNVLDDKDIRLIKRCCVLPRLGLAALVMSSVSMVLLIPLEMVADLVFHRQSFSAVPLTVVLALVIANMAAFIYCVLYPTFVQRGKHWKQLVVRLRVEQDDEDRSAQAAAGVETVTTAAGILFQTRRNAEEVAEAYGIAVPKVKKHLIAYVLACVAIVVAPYIPVYLQANDELAQTVAVSSTRVAAVSDALRPTCEYVSADDPAERYQEYGYNVRGYLHGSDERDCYIYVCLDVSGQVESVHYTEELDVNKTMEENVSQVEEDFAAMGAGLAGLDVPVKTDGLLSTRSLTDGFKEQLLAGNVYTAIDYTYETVGDVRLQSVFETKAASEFDEHTRPTVTLGVYPQ